MGKKKGAVAAKARAKREAKQSPNSPRQTGAVAAALNGGIVRPDGCRVHRGLQNLGNTCYMNSIVQCLNASFPFSDEVLAAAPPSAGGMCSSLSTTFRGIRGLDGDSKGTSYNPQPLRQQVVTAFPWFRGKEQHDAHEFLRTLLGAVSDEFEESAKAAAKSSGSNGVTSGSNGAVALQDLVTSNFGGRFCAATLCWGCSRLSLRLDPFSDLQLHLPTLAGQHVAAMGVSAAAISGELAVPADDPPADSESDSGGRKKKRKGGRRKDAPSPKVAPKAAPKAQPKLGGVWGAARDREELLENTRAYMLAFWVRLLRRRGELDAEEGEAAEPPEELEEFAVELARKKAEHPQWGFRWSEAKCEDSQFVLVSVVEDTPLDKWNFKRRTMGEMDKVVCAGDRLSAVNDKTDYAEMSKLLRNADKVTLTFGRPKHGAAVKADQLGPSCPESDGEQERKQQEAANKEQRRKDFCSSAERVFEALPPELRELFGAEAPNKDSLDKLPLARCLQHFSACETIEDDFKPVYTCTKCGKEEKGKRTYASRRMWLCAGALPPLLTMQLKRFRRYRDKFEKSVASIALPPLLDLSQYVLHEDQLQRMKPFVEKGLEDVEARCDPNPPEEGAPLEAALRYELYALCVHQGTTMKAGHYVAYVNGGPSLEKECWYGVSDARVWKCPRTEVLNAEGYLVFYRREGAGVAAAEAAAAAAAAEVAEAEAADADAEADGSGVEAEDAEN